MLKESLFAAALALVAAAAYGEASDLAGSDQDTVASEDLPVDVPEGPRAMSGMSILGNEEAPKSLVIIPWKSSELGDDVSITDTLDDRARPIDREVFLRELSFYTIRSGQ